MRPALAVVLAALLIAGCAVDTASTAVPGETNTVATPEAVTPTEAAEPPEEAPPGEPVRYKPGEKITISVDGEPWAEVTVSKVKTVKSYKGEYLNDKPEVKGNVFMQAFVTYRALQDGVEYGLLDWQWFAAGEIVDTFTIVLNGPKPALAAGGTLPKGRKASGWIVQEVPAKGQILLSYRSNMFLDEPPVFEVVLRAK